MLIRSLANTYNVGYFYLKRYYYTPKIVGTPPSPAVISATNDND